jgi:hypothetical protein
MSRFRTPKVLLVLFGISSAGFAQSFPNAADPNAFWVKMDGTVEAQKVVGDSAASYFFEPPGRLGKVGVSKAQIIFFSETCSDWISFINDISADKAQSAVILDKIAARYETRPEMMQTLPAGLDAALEQPTFFNKLPERFRKLVLRRAAQEAIGIETIKEAALNAVNAAKEKIDTEAQNQPEAMEMAARETKVFTQGLSGPRSLERDKYTEPQKARLLALARAKAKEILLKPLIAELSGGIALLQISGATDVIHEFEQKVLKPALGGVFPPVNTEVIQAYRSMFVASLLAGNLPAYRSSIFVPELPKQPVFQEGEAKAKLIGDTEFGRFQLTEVDGVGIFLSSSGISAEETLNTQTLLLDGLTEPMKQFFASDVAKQGNFMMAAALKEPKVETIQDIPFVRAIPLVVLTRDSAGKFAYLYSAPEVSALIASAQAFPAVPQQAQATPSDSADAAPKVDGAASVGVVASVKDDITGRWEVTADGRTAKIEIQPDGYTSDRAYRLRDFSGNVLLKTPEGTWTLSWQAAGSLSGKSDTSSDEIVLKKY